MSEIVNVLREIQHDRDTKSRKSGSENSVPVSMGDTMGGEDRQKIVLADNTWIRGESQQMLALFAVVLILAVIFAITLGFKAFQQTQIRGEVVEQLIAIIANQNSKIEDLEDAISATLTDSMKTLSANQDDRLKELKSDIKNIDIVMRASKHDMTVLKKSIQELKSGLSTVEAEQQALQSMVQPARSAEPFGEGETGSSRMKIIEIKR